MIEKRNSPRYIGICDNCGWKTNSVWKESVAERDLSWHKCGEHRQKHDSTGGYRGILGGFNMRCVCGEGWVVDDLSVGFHCPKNPAEVSA